MILEASQDSLVSYLETCRRWAHCGNCHLEFHSCLCRTRNWWIPSQQPCNATQCHPWHEPKYLFPLIKRSVTCKGVNRYLQVSRPTSNQIHGWMRARSKVGHHLRTSFMDDPQRTNRQLLAPSLLQYKAIGLTDWPYNSPLAYQLTMQCVTASESYKWNISKVTH